MKISFNWLKNYIDKEVDVKDVSTILTDCGLEVESVEEFQSVKGGLDGLVIGEILTVAKHPDADRLNLTTVNIGNDTPLNIVCGAPNVAAHQKVVVAPVGTILYNGKESFKIKKSKIRGKLSEGMICAEDEIGLGNAHNGIMVLREEVKVGTLAKDYFNVENDVVFEIGLTPNRADATGHIGVARDLATVLSLKNKVNLVLPKTDNFKTSKHHLPIKVKVENPDLCPRYSGVCIENIEVKSSPKWLQSRLKSIGLAPINNIVDATNFVLHETGQPLHAFDYDKIFGNEIIVKTVKNNTKFTTLDEVKRALSDKDLMICNVSEPMCMAGIFGGIDSGVSNQTKNIFIESAYFNPVTIRKTAKRHGLNTDSSFRFERGADPNITIFALKRAVLLIQEIAGGEIASDIVDVYAQPIENFKVTLNYKNCDRLIGKAIDRDLIKNILINLEIKIVSENKESLKLSVPPFKADVTREVDVIEEILRIYGYNNIELPNKLNSSLVYQTKPNKGKIKNTIANLLVDNGFNEILSNSLTKSSYYPNLEQSLVHIKNPLSNDLNVLRKSMLFSGLEAIVYNQNRKMPHLKLFEMGKTYFKDENNFSENFNLSVFISGNWNNQNWKEKTISSDFSDIKGIIFLILKKLGIQNLTFEVKETNSNELSLGLDYFFKKKLLFQIGKVNDNYQSNFKIDNTVFYAFIDFNFLMELSTYHKIEYKEISKYPSVKRDLALLINKNVKYSTLKEIAQKQDKKILKAVNLFDVYEGKNLDNNKKSYALSFLFQDENKTLTDKEIDKTMNKIIVALKSETGAELR